LISADIRRTFVISRVAIVASAGLVDFFSSSCPHVVVRLPGLP
jgi:hypothetical protein